MREKTLQARHEPKPHGPRKGWENTQCSKPQKQRSDRSDRPPHQSTQPCTSTNQRAVGSNVPAERYWASRVFTRVWSLEPRTHIPPGTAVGTSNRMEAQSFCASKTHSSFFHATRFCALSNQPLLVTACFAGFAAHKAEEGLQRCFPAPYIEPLAVDPAKFIFQFWVCSLGMAPPKSRAACCGPESSVLTAQGELPSDVSAANIAAGDRVQKTRRERVPFCDGGNNARQGFRQAFARKRPFDTSGEQTKSRACQTEFS